MRKFCYRGGELLLNRCYLFGILNATPDSFSDGGRFTAPEEIRRQAETLRDAGADVIDLGCESTRPGYTPVAEEEELRRLKHALPAALSTGLPLSVDTLKVGCARYALDTGATILNTVCDITRNPELVEVAAEFGAGLIVTHNRATDDLAADFADYFETTLHMAERAGLAKEQLCFDPGVGFAKEERQSAEAVRLLPELRQYGVAVMLAASRKRLVGAMTGAPLEDEGTRDFGTAVLSAVGEVLGADFLRVHEVGLSKRALGVSGYLREIGGDF